MDFIQYRNAILRSQSNRWKPRQKRLNALSRILDGRQYDHLRYAFSQERDGDGFTGKRILLDERRPAVQMRKPKELVREQCGLLFGEDHRPIVVVKKPKQDAAKAAKPVVAGTPPQRAEPEPPDPTTEWIAAFVHDTKFWLILMDALWKGSVGSACVVLRVLGKTKPEIDDETQEQRNVNDGPGRFYFEVWKGEECTPVFEDFDPEALKSVDRRWFIGEDALAAQGYNIDQLKQKWRDKAKRFKTSPLTGNQWAMRIKLDTDEETCYDPVPRHVYEHPDWTDDKWTIDQDRSFPHSLGEFPGHWCVPLPLDADDLFPDGHCLFEDVIDPEFRENRTASQVGRAFDYTGDPQMARGIDKATGTVSKSTFGQPLAVGGSASDILEGDAKFVEITGTGLQIAIEAYADYIDDRAKRAGAMSRVVPSSKTGASPELSSVSMKMLNTSQLTVSGILRETAGEVPGDHLLRVAMRMFMKVDVELPSLEDDVTPDPTARFEWQWPAYYEPHGQEKVFEVQAASSAAEANLISQETAVENVGPLFDVQDTQAELSKIEGNKADALSDEVVKTDMLGAVNAKYDKTGADAGQGAT